MRKLNIERVLLSGVLGLEILAGALEPVSVYASQQSDENYYGEDEEYEYEAYYDEDSENYDYNEYDNYDYEEDGSYYDNDNGILSNNYYCYVNDETDKGYQVLFDDKAELFTVEDIEGITDLMYFQGLPYGNMVMLTTLDAQGMSAKDYQWWVYSSIYGEEASGVVFLIDMDNRKLWIQGYGSLSKLVDEDAANTITDKIYGYASDEEYGKCALEGYNLVVKALRRENISGSLKYVGNACLAVIASLLITFILAYTLSASRRAADKEILDNIDKVINLSDKRVVYTHTERIYDPPSDSDSGGSSGGGGGGGGGGHGF